MRERDADNRDMEESGSGLRTWDPIAKPQWDMESKSSSSLRFLGCRFQFRKSAFDSYAAACEAFSEKPLLLLRLLGFGIQLL